MIDVVLFIAFAALGLAAQRRLPAARSERWRRGVWGFNYVVCIPAAAIYTFLTIDLAGGLARVAALAVLAWWTTVAVSFLYARAVARTRAQRGALTMAGAFPNTGFVGFPLAHLAFGTAGLRAAVVYDQVGLVIPAIVVSNIIAAAHAGPGHAVGRTEQREWREMARLLVVNPPLWAAAGAILIRVLLHPAPVEGLEWLGRTVGHVVGPVGFFLVGISLSLEPLGLARSEVWRGAGAVAIRLAAAPALLGAWSVATGVAVPAVWFLVAGMPTAFHVLVITRLHRLETQLIRLVVVASTVISVVTWTTWAALR